MPAARFPRGQHRPDRQAPGRGQGPVATRWHQAPTEGWPRQTHAPRPRAPHRHEPFTLPGIPRSPPAPSSPPALQEQNESLPGTRAFLANEGHLANKGHFANEGPLANADQGPWGHQHQPGVVLVPGGSLCTLQRCRPAPQALWLYRAQRDGSRGQGGFLGGRAPSISSWASEAQGLLCEGGCKETRSYLTSQALRSHLGLGQHGRSWDTLLGR